VSQFVEAVRATAQENAFLCARQVATAGAFSSSSHSLPRPQGL